MAPSVWTSGSRHTGLAAPPQRNIQNILKEGEKIPLIYMLDVSINDKNQKITITKIMNDEST